MEESNRHLFDCNQCLFRQLSTRVVPSDEFELIRRTSVQLHFEKGETILRQGAASHHLVFLHRGLVKFSYHYDSGKNYIMTIVTGPKLLGTANLFFRQTNIFSLVAMEDCDVCLLDGKALRMVAQRHGAFVLDLCERTTEMFESAIFNFISMAHKQVHGRIADILLYLWNYIYKTRPDDFVITRKELAEFAACSHENVIHTLSRFNKEGILSLEGRKIVIRDMERLQEISKRG
ncbi:MAG TPA: Crp/Fnr family transcriptional regulator [Bacteroidales bacterium]|nr:Crp/Fnr family transcriptional regulator [Bacteroidales bacterium]HPS62238.1 Crp/Fnr family transcriptional regulator [Bacteroidales bacterium]